MDHIPHTIAGSGGLALRRLIHLSIPILPITYYLVGDPIGEDLHLSKQQLISIVCLMALGLEAIRLHLRIIVIGQRQYEASQPSAFVWGAVAITLALLAVPEGAGSGLANGRYALPLIFGLAFVDPVMGELRRAHQPLALVLGGGLIVSYGAWGGCYIWLQTPLLLAVLLAPLTVIGEILPSGIIDDNMTIVVVPMVGLILLYPLLGV